MPLFLKWLRQQPMGPDFPHSLPDFVSEAELRSADTRNPTAGCLARFTKGGLVPKPHPKSQLEWPGGKPRGGKPPTRENGEIAYCRPKA